ncbi:MAG: DNA-3-methyladenine glycosylase 2 family protein [Clostridia bacterium]|nr:DNA-3-methyladenine glycosylase 2 family protein [Clostridia bacterium]
MRKMDCALTLMDSAQAFHFRFIDGVYAACVQGRLITDKDEDEFAGHYFDDERDYASLLEKEGLDEKTKRALSSLPGLRVLNQPAWEAVCAFIISANNNVGRIRTTIALLNEKYGQSVEYKGERLFGFPSPEVLSNISEEELRGEIKCGYRAKYLIGTAKMIVNGFPLERLRDVSYEECRKELMKLPGVGGKVADCAALFGLGHASAFPVDVWVKRLMESWFSVKGTPEHVREEARRIFGENCGLYQQWLFHAARTGLIEV